MEKLGGHTEETLSALKLIFSFSQEEITLKKYDEIAEATRKIATKAAILQGSLGGMFYTVMFGFSLYAYSVASVLLTNKVNNVVTGQSYTVGEIVAIAQATVTSMYTFGSVIPILPIILRARVSAKKVFDVIERKPSITSAPDCKEVATLQKGIQFENVSFRYPT